MCPKCKKYSTALHYDHGSSDFICRHCLVRVSDPNCAFIVYGSENPADPEGSTAHVRDIKDRRWDPIEKRQFYYSKEQPKSYFFSKGK